MFKNLLKIIQRKFTPIRLHGRWKDVMALELMNIAFKDQYFDGHDYFRRLISMGQRISSFTNNTNKKVVHYSQSILE